MPYKEWGYTLQLVLYFIIFLMKCFYENFTLIGALIPATDSGFDSTTYSGTSDVTYSSVISSTEKSLNDETNRDISKVMVINGK